MAKTFLQIQTAVLLENKLDSTSELLTWIKGVINEVIQDFCNTAKYRELKARNEALTIATDAQSNYDLPVEAQRVERIEFCIDANSEAGWYPLKKENQHVVISAIGLPRYYDLSGTTCSIYPYDQIVASTHRLRITYNKQHPTLSGDSDVLLIPSLFPAIVQKVNARVARWHNANDKLPSIAREAAEAQVHSLNN